MRAAVGKAEVVLRVEDVSYLHCQLIVVSAMAGAGRSAGLAGRSAGLARRSAGLPAGISAGDFCRDACAGGAMRRISSLCASLCQVRRGLSRS